MGVGTPAAGAPVKRKGEPGGSPLRHFELALRLLAEAPLARTARAVLLRLCFALSPVESYPLRCSRANPTLTPATGRMQGAPEGAPKARFWASEARKSLPVAPLDNETQNGTD